MIETRKGPFAGIPPTRRTVAAANMLYRDALRAGEQAHTAQHRRIRGINRLAPSMALEELARQVVAAEADACTQMIKEEPFIHVMRCSLMGKDTLLKRYDLKSLPDKLKYLFRPSRARRFWAAARTMQQVGIPTPEPYGYLEIMQGTVPVQSYVFTAFVPETQTAREWIEPHFHQQPRALRDAVRKDLLAALLLLYRHGIYHRDTKTANLLLHAPCDDEQRLFLWIDLECVQPGVIPSRHQIIRNLVQLNGSLGLEVAGEDRMAFLDELAHAYPWVVTRPVIEKIAAWTARRLRKERITGCGS
ncbi:MAG: hypothetical protein EOM20_09605 [Spartobacteria bacterium]|nr:hypothetical protein [Spartobacteria bacterium]